MILIIEHFVNAGVKTVQIKDAKHFWVRMRDVEKGLGLKALRNLVKQEISGTGCDDCKKYKRSLQELTNNMNDNVKDIFIRYKIYM